MSDAFLAHAALWVATIVWGGSFVAARVVLHPQAAGDVVLSPVILAATRFSLASLFFVMPLTRAILGRRLGRRHLIKLAALGQTAFSVYFWLQYVGVQKTNAGISSILVVGLTPVTTAVVAQIVGGEALGTARLGALALGFAGVLVITVQTRGLAVSLDPGFFFGSLCLIANAIGWGLNSTLAKQWMRDEALSPTLMTGGPMAFGAFGLILISLTSPAANRWSDVMRLDSTRWLALLYIVLACSVGGYLLYNFALTKVSASQAAFYSYFEPVVAVSLGVSLLGERLSWPMVAGALMIGCAALMIGRAPRIIGPGAPESSGPAR